MDLYKVEVVLSFKHKQNTTLGLTAVFNSICLVHAPEDEVMTSYMYCKATYHILEPYDEIRVAQMDRVTCNSCKIVVNKK